MLAENLAGEIAASASFEADVSILGTTGVAKAEPIHTLHKTIITIIL